MQIFTLGNPVRFGLKWFAKEETSLAAYEATPHQISSAAAALFFNFLLTVVYLLNNSSLAVLRKLQVDCISFNFWLLYDFTCS